MRNALEKIEFRPCDEFIWMAGESAMIRPIRSYLVDERHHPADWLRAAGY
jgi:NADPH-dependent ferric siderophore reductase